jgi:hypothetical protein
VVIQSEKPNERCTTRRCLAEKQRHLRGAVAQQRAGGKLDGGGELTGATQLRMIRWCVAQWPLGLGVFDDAGKLVEYLVSANGFSKLKVASLAL